MDTDISAYIFGGNYSKVIITKLYMCIQNDYTIIVIYSPLPILESNDENTSNLILSGQIICSWFIEFLIRF